MKGQKSVIFAIVIVIIISVFAIMNMGKVEVSYIFWKGYSPLILVILFSVLMGVLVTAVAGSSRYRKLNKKHQALRKQFGLPKEEKQSEKDISNKA